MIVGYVWMSGKNLAIFVHVAVPLVLLAAVAVLPAAVVAAVAKH